MLREIRTSSSLCFVNFSLHSKAFWINCVVFQLQYRKRRVITLQCICCFSCSMKHSNCYMVWGGDLVSNQQTRFSQEDMVVGCLVDLATGLMTFTANGKEINTFYQVRQVTHYRLCVYLYQCFLDSNPDEV